LCGHVGGGSIFVGCCGVIDSSPAWFIFKIKNNTYAGGLFLGGAYGYGRLDGY